MADDITQKLIQRLDRLIELQEIELGIASSDRSPTPLPIAPPEIKLYQLDGYKQLQKVYDDAQEKISKYHPYLGYFSEYFVAMYDSKIPKPTKLYPVPSNYVNKKIQEWATVNEAYYRFEDWISDLAECITKDVKTGSPFAFKTPVEEKEYTEKKYEYLLQHYEKGLKYRIHNKEMKYFDNLQEIYFYFLEKAAEVMFTHIVLGQMIEDQLGFKPPQEIDEEIYFLDEFENSKFVFKSLLTKNITSPEQIKIEDLEPYGFDISGNLSNYTGSAMTEDLLIEIPVSRCEEY